MNEQFKRFFWIGYCVVLVLFVYRFADIYLTAQNTGILKISSSSTSALISISQENHQASYIGTGSAHVRIAPGTYLLSASSNGSRTWATINVNAKQTSDSYLNLSKTYTLPSADNIDFENTAALINNGLTVTQITNLQRDFFNYKNSTKVVNVNPDSVEPEAHNPNVDTSFSLNFNVSIDSIPYKAVVSYSGLNNIRLVLYTSNNAQVFDSNTVSAPGGD